MKPEDAFSRFAHAATDRIARPGAFIVALAAIFLWFLLGHYFKYSPLWQAAINTTFSIVTFLLVLLLQHSQNHDTRVIQMKLDELIHSQARAANDFIEIEKLTEAEVESIRDEQNEARRQRHQKNQETIPGRD